MRTRQYPSSLRRCDRSPNGPLWNSIDGDTKPIVNTNRLHQRGKYMTRPFVIKTPVLLMEFCTCFV
jgi:hypothetical protein